MNRDLAALASAPLVGGSNIFKMIAVGETFRFPKQIETLTKISAGQYRDSQGRVFRTGTRTAVNPALSAATLELISEAGAMGKAAFAAGRSAVPCHDPDVTTLLQRNTEGMTAAADILGAWAKAWHAANAAAPV